MYPSQTRDASCKVTSAIQGRGGGDTRDSSIGMILTKYGHIGVDERCIYIRGGGGGGEADYVRGRKIFSPLAEIGTNSK